MKIKFLNFDLNKYFQINLIYQLISRFVSTVKNFLFNNLSSETIQDEEIFKQNLLLVKKLINECYSQNLTKEEVNELCEEYILSPLRYRHWRTKGLILIKYFLVLILILTIFVWLNPFNRFFEFLGRIILFKILPFIDWIYIYKTNCLVSNPFYTQEFYIIQERCNLCVDLTEVARIEKIDSKNSENFIFNEIPFLISSKNETKDWLLLNTSLEDIKKIYESLPITDICMFQSNIKSNDPLFMINLITKYNLSWYAHWENCGIASKKAFRKLYKRPSFLPLYTELTLSNWIIISNKFTANTWKYLDVDLSCQIAVVVQIKGELSIKLEPNDQCSEVGCQELSVHLKEGDFLAYGPNKWKLLYFPNNSTFNLSFMIEGYFE